MVQGQLVGGKVREFCVFLSALHQHMHPIMLLVLCIGLSVDCIGYSGWLCVFTSNHGICLRLRSAVGC